MPNLHDVQLLLQVASIYERTLLDFINNEKNPQELVVHAQTELNDLIAQFQDEEAWEHALEIFLALEYLLK